MGKANADYYRARQRCVRCGEQDAFTIIGKRLCADCTEKQAQSSAKYGKEHRRELTAYQREWAQKRRDAGLCPRCGRKPEDGYKTCSRCRSKDNRRRERQRRENGVTAYCPEGVCWTCRKRPVLEGKKLCAECYEKSLSSLAKAREAEARMGANAWVTLYSKRGGGRKDATERDAPPG